MMPMPTSILIGWTICMLIRSVIEPSTNSLTGPLAQWQSV